MAAVGEPRRFSPREEQARWLAEAIRQQLGPLCSLLAEPDIVEIALNPNGRV